MKNGGKLGKFHSELDQRSQYLTKKFSVINFLFLQNFILKLVEFAHEHFNYDLNRTTRIRQKCSKTTVLSCHICLIENRIE
jgi:hypothetical protein